MTILHFDPTSQTGPEGYINYKLSGGDSNGGNGEGSGGGNGCSFVVWFIVILILIEILSKCSS